ncbi:sensor histidine kinase [Pseudonocardia nigra]|uniref:sensor histidine kinase n=1 Tax=Pseudonocardia nigra TaxID=1921578 RepID=UPI0027E38F92|nr:sensor histidine kinase [Pseudonocardia nigra]
MDQSYRSRALAVDLGLGLLVVVVVGVAVAADLEDRRPGPSAYLLVLGFGALMLVRRRRPVVTLLATAALLIGYYALGHPAIGLAVPVAAALYSAAEHGRACWAVGTAAALLTVSVVFRVREGDDLALLFGYELASSAGLMAAVIALGDGVRSRRGWRAELRRQAAAAAAEREREASRRVEQERLRIARELHDVLAHTLSVVTLHTDVAREALEDDGPDLPAARHALAAVRTAAGGASRELRTTVTLLRAPGDGDDGPVPGLDQLDRLVQAAVDGGVRVRVDSDAVPADLPAVADATAFRIVQESLTNVVRHTRARTATVAVHQDADALTVRVDDDGRGRPGVRPAEGYGLAGMRERAVLLGGSLEAGPGDRGWVVEAVLPLGGQE